MAIENETIRTAIILPQPQEMESVSLMFFTYLGLTVSPFL